MQQQRRSIFNMRKVFTFIILEAKNTDVNEHNQYNPMYIHIDTNTTHNLLTLTILLELVRLLTSLEGMVRVNRIWYLPVVYV